MVEYDPMLECAAQRYMNELGGAAFEHNPNAAQYYAECGGEGPVGENWYSGGPGTNDVRCSCARRVGTRRRAHATRHVFHFQFNVRDTPA